MKKIKILFLLLISLCLFCGCKDDKDDNEGKLKVMLTADAGITVKTDNPVYVNSGENAVFEIEIGTTFVIDTIEGASISDNKVTAENITRDTIVKISTIDLGYNTHTECKYYFEGDASDTSSVVNGAAVKTGTEVTVSAKNKTDKFIGWSIGAKTTDVSKMISTDRDYTFRISPDLLDANNVIKLYANYSDASFYYYDPNGGNINMGTTLAKDCTYYQAAKEGERLKITTASVYREVYESVHLFYDDGSFTREGYVLKEYNTKPDGTGEGYSLGSMFYPDPDKEASILYCIWAKETDAAQFTYEDVEYPLPAGVSREKASHWNVSGVKITSYTGDADTLVIPEKLGGKPVTAIASGAVVNKTFTTLVLSKNLLRIDDGAFAGCSNLETVYYSDAIYIISSNVFDAATYTNFRHFYSNATMAPRSGASGYSVKLSRLLAGVNEKKIIMIAGSSSYQGFASEYMEALIKDYRVVNFGTTRTTHGAIYLEAMKHYADADDIVLYAPENSTYMIGESELYWKTLRDLEGMNNFFRYIDISNYTNLFSAYSEYNKEHKYGSNPTRYESGYDTITKKDNKINKYGEIKDTKRVSLSDSYVDVYYITLNERIKSKYEGEWDNVANQEASKDYNDPNNITWQSITDPVLSRLMNHAIDSAKSGGAKVYFSFCPMDADKVVNEARNIARTAEYDNLIKNTYNFDGVLGTSANYIFAHKYFYDNAFHPNDIGRAYRTYRVYIDLCNLLGKTPAGYLSEGDDFEGCIFEETSDGTPITKVDYLN